MRTRPVLRQAQDCGAVRGRRAGLRRDLLAPGFAHLALELLAALGQLLVAGLHQEGVEPAAPLHRLQCVRTDAQPHLALQRVGDQRHLAQVGAEGALGLVLGMAAYLAGHGQLARQLASPCHGKAPLAGRRENPRAYRRSRAVLYEASRTSRLHAVPACQFGPAMTEFFTPSALWWPRHTIDAKPDSFGSRGTVVASAWGSEAAS